MSGVLLILTLLATGGGWAFVQSRRGTGKPVGPDIAAFAIALILFIAWLASFVVEVAR